MSFSFEDRTRALLRAIWVAGTISGAAPRVGMDVSNAARHLRTAERRAGVRLVDRRRGGRGGRNARLTRHGHAVLAAGARVGVALHYDPAEGVTPIRIGRRTLAAAGHVPPGPVEVEIPPASVALERAPPTHGNSSVRNRVPARVEGIEPVADGVWRIALSAGALRLDAIVVRGALRDLGLRVGSKVHAVVKAASIVATPRGSMRAID